MWPADWRTWLKRGLLAALLFAALYLVGAACSRLVSGYSLFFAPSAETVGLLVRAFIALLCALLAASLVAALMRPVRLALLCFALSCGTFLAAWEFTPTPVVLSAVYFLLAALYLRSVVGELEDRVRFSVGGLCQPQNTLLFALGVLLSGAVFFAQAAQIEREGVRIPDTFREAVHAYPRAQIERQVEAGEMSRAEGERALVEIEQQFEEQFAEWEQAIRPFRVFVPVLPAILLLQLVVLVFGALGWLPRLLLAAAFWLLRRSGFTREVSEAAVVRRLVLA